jgi:CHAT domain-containing protein
MALAFAHNGSLPGVYREADLVGGLFGGTVYCDVAASRERLRSAPTQILHIAAHGKHMIDRPELSYIELADGPLFTDDLLQYDLSCELVTLSACETGRARPSGGDELIGLGRAVLYAGAAALVTTLWAINDDYAVRLMEQFYLALRAGMSKAAALRHAQQSLLRARPQTHPAFWAAFQLVGNPAPLTFAEASEAVGATS